MFAVSGVDFRSATPAELDAAHLTPTKLRALFAEAKARGVSVLALSTCNRTEVYESSDGPHRSGWWPTGTGGRGATAHPAISLTGSAALRHLFAVTSGLASQVLGEDQILVQVKEAWAASHYAGCMGGTLDHICRDAFTCAKAVKTSLDFGAVPRSVCALGLEAVGPIAGKRVFVIGSGVTASQAVEICHRKGAAAIAVTNRSPERVLGLVERFGVTPVPFDARYAAIAEADIVISATKSPHFVVRAAEVKLAHPVTFLDLASPRDIEAEVRGAGCGVRLIALSDLVDTNVRREALLAEGMKIVDEQVERTAEWLGM